MTTQHTSGEWRHLLSPLQIVTDKSVIATIHAVDGEHYSNARLIAAAPELLEACQSLHAIVAAFVQDELSVTTIDEAADLLPKLEATIAKATGGQS